MHFDKLVRDHPLEDGPFDRIASRVPRDIDSLDLDVRPADRKLVTVHVWVSDLRILASQLAVDVFASSLQKELVRIWVHCDVVAEELEQVLVSGEDINAGLMACTRGSRGLGRIRATARLARRFQNLGG